MVIYVAQQDNKGQKSLQISIKCGQVRELNLKIHSLLKNVDTTYFK